VEFFRNPNIDFLGKKWYFLAFSLVFSVAGILSMLFWHGIPLGVDFRGGTLVYVKFSHAPNDNVIRAALQRAGLQRARIQRYGPVSNNEVLIDLDVRETSEKALDEGKTQIINALETNAPAGKQDLNNASSLTLQNYLLEKDPLHVSTDANQRYAAVAQAIVNHRDKAKSGVLSSLDELTGAVDPAVVSTLSDGFFVSDFGVRNVEIVGPQVGQQLRKQALLATIYSLAGMLIYLGFRFEWIYGVAAVVTVFHDTLITLGAFSLMNKEISLTVIAAILLGPRHDRRVRPDPREPETDAARETGRHRQSQHQPDFEPDHLDSGFNLSNGPGAVSFRGRSVAWFFVRPGGGNPDRDILLDRDRRPHSGGLSGLAWYPGKAAFDSFRPES
jgi:preprotein translocase subunit SecF